MLLYINSFKCSDARSFGMGVCYMKQMTMTLSKDVKLYKRTVDVYLNHTKDHKLLLSAGKTSNAI